MKIKIYTPDVFNNMDSAYWGLGSSTDKVYIGLCSHNPDLSASFYALDRKTQEISALFKLSDVIPPQNSSLPQGKIHTKIFEGTDKNIYFGTHFAYPFGKPQEVTFEGGHLVKYDPSSGKAEDLGIAIPGEGILTLEMDATSMMLYGLSAPSFIFFAYDIKKQEFKVLDRITTTGSICRSLVIDEAGDVYGTFEENKFFRYSFKLKQIEYLDVQFPPSAVAVKEWDTAYRGGVNYIGRKIWRSAVFDQISKKIYGIHAENSQLFKLDLSSKKVDFLTFFAEENSQDNLDKIYPTLSLGIYNDTLYYVPSNGMFDYCRSENLLGHSNLLSFNVKTGVKKDHGILFSEERNVLGVAGSTITKDGTFYLVGAVDALEGENYLPMNTINGKGFKIGLIEIDTKGLSQ